MNVAKRDYYEVLGVERGVDDQGLKGAYRKLALNSIRIAIRMTAKRKRNSRKPPRLTAS